MATLPNEIIIAIIKFLPLINRIKLRTVCKLWQLLESMVDKPIDLNNLELVLSVPHNHGLMSLHIYKNKLSFKNKDKWFNLEHKKLIPLIDSDLPCISNYQYDFDACCWHECSSSGRFELIIKTGYQIDTYDSYYQHETAKQFPTEGWYIYQNISGYLEIYTKSGLNYRLQRINGRFESILTTNLPFFKAFNTYEYYGFDEYDQGVLYMWNKEYIEKIKDLETIVFKRKVSEYIICLQFKNDFPFVTLTPRTTSLYLPHEWEYNGFIYRCLPNTLEVYQTIV